MKIKFLSSLAVAGMLALVTGCVGTVDGHSTVAMPVGKDKIVRRYDRPVAQVAEATRAVLVGEDKKLLANDIVGNTFIAKVKDSKVWIKLAATTEDPKVTEVTVQVRRKGNSNIDLASELTTEIALQLATTAP